MKLTTANLAKIKRNAAGKSDHIEWDDRLPGFGLRVRGDSLVWVFQYKIQGRGHHRLRLGTLKELTPDRAYDLARAQKGKVSEAKLGHGLDPATEREKRRAEIKPPRAETLGAIVARYLEAKESAMRPRSYEETRRHLETVWRPLHSLKLAQVTRAHVAGEVSIIAKGRGPVSANRARASLSAFFRWAIGEGLCDANPVIGTNKREENGPRDRALSDAEAAAVWLAAPENEYGRIVRLILLTGCRREEIASLRWQEIDLEAATITLPGERTKNGQTHVVPLSESAKAILGAIPVRAGRELVFGQGKGGFSNWAKSKQAIDKDAKLKEAWTLHDLRRTVRTGLGKLGVQPHVAEAVLNHLPPKLIRTYDRNTYAAEKKAALDMWAAHLSVAVAQASGANVTALRKTS